MTTPAAQPQKGRRILVVEDDRALATVLEVKLAMEGFEVESVGDGLRAPDAARAFAPDLIILDVSLPGRDGFELCELWRQGPEVPIIMLTARSDKASKLRGLMAGADDYIAKPFDTQELVARIHSVLRRLRPAVTRLRFGAVSIDLEHSLAQDGNGPLRMTHREFQMLKYLAERANRIVHRDDLLRAVWGTGSLPYTHRAVDQAIARLRKKIETHPHQPRYLHTAHGDGYYLTLRDSDAD